MTSDTLPSPAALSNPASLTSRPASRSARTLRTRLVADTSRQTSCCSETTPSSSSRARPPTDTSNPSTHSCGSATTIDSRSACKVRQSSPTSTSTFCPARHAVACMLSCDCVRCVAKNTHQHRSASQQYAAALLPFFCVYYIFFSYLCFGLCCPRFLWLPQATANDGRRGEKNEKGRQREGQTGGKQKREMGLWFVLFFLSNRTSGKEKRRSKQKKRRVLLENSNWIKFCFASREGEKGVGWESVVLYIFFISQY